MSPFEDPLVLIRILIGFTVTALLVVGCKKFLNRFPVLSTKNPNIPGRKLWSYSLSPRHSIYLVEVFGQVYLLGAGPEKVEILDRIENQKVDHYLAELDEKIPTSNPTLPINLNKLIQR